MKPFNDKYIIFNKDIDIVTKSLNKIIYHKGMAYEIVKCSISASGNFTVRTKNPNRWVILHNCQTFTESEMRRKKIETIKSKI